MRRSYFTIMEVMIAATILVFGVAATMSIVGGSRSTLLRAEKRWARQHLLAQATEFYLAAGAEATPPDWLLPEGFSCSCALQEIEDLHEEAQEPIREWMLGEYHVCIYDSSGAVIAEQRVRKLVKEEDLYE